MTDTTPPDGARATRFVPARDGWIGAADPDALAALQAAHDTGAGFAAGDADRGASATWVPLPWDSGILGVSVGRVAGPHGWGAPEPAFSLRTVLDAALGATLEDADARGVSLLVARCGAAHIAPLYALQTSGFVLTDTLVTLRLPAGDRAPAAAPLGDVRIEEHDRGETSAIARLRALGVAFTTDHFHADPRLAPDRIDRLYAEWIENSVRGRADGVLVARRPDGTPLGILTCRLPTDGQRVGVIELVAVAPTAQGGGVGRALLARALDWFDARECAAVDVGTQVANRAAVALYQRAGFRARTFAHTLHRWSSAAP